MAVPETVLLFSVIGLDMHAALSSVGANLGIASGVEMGVRGGQTVIPRPRALSQSTAQLYSHFDQELVFRSAVSLTSH